MERNDISYLVMKACVIGALIIISCLSVSCGQTSLCQLSVFKNSSILSGRDTVEMFTLVNANGMSVQVTNYAASLRTSLFLTDKGVLNTWFWDLTVWNVIWEDIQNWELR